MFTINKTQAVIFLSAFLAVLFFVPTPTILADHMAPPKITSISPSATNYTELVEIIGENFGSTKGSSRVFGPNNREQKSVHSWSDTNIKVVVGNFEDPRNFYLVIERSQEADTSPVMSNTFPLKIIPWGPPKIIRVSPYMVKPGGVEIRIYGENFGMPGNSDVSVSNARVYDAEGNSQKVITREHDQIRASFDFKTYDETTNSTTLYVKVKCLDEDCSGGVDGPDGKDYVSNMFSVDIDNPLCTSWTYSDWSELLANNTYSRKILSSSPFACAGGSPVTTKFPPVVAPTVDTNTVTAITSTTATGNGNVISDGGATITERGTVVSTSKNPSVEDKKFTTTVSIGQYTTSMNGLNPSTLYHVRAYAINPSGTSYGADVSFTTTPSSSICNVDTWTCGEWNACSAEGEQTRTCSITTDCLDVSTPSPATSQSCTYNGHTIPAVITSISPKVITPGDVITISGSNFGQSQGSSKIVVGGSGAYGTILSWTDTEIKYQTSMSFDNNSSKIGVSKCEDYWTCLSVVYGGYFYIQPQITSLDSSVGREGWKVTIFGKYLKNSNVSSDNSTQYFIKVYFNSINALYPQNGIWTSEKVEVVVPKGATSGTVTLEIVADNTNDKVTATGPNFQILEKISNDEFSDMQLYFKQVNIPQAWGIASNRRMIVVAVIDDGVYNNHPDLKNKMWENAKEIIGNGIDDDNNGYIDDHYGWNFLDNSPDVTPRGTHGTQVAGIIGAETNNGIGMAGVNWNVKIMPLIITDKQNNFVSWQQINNAIRYAVNNGAEVINLSFGSVAVSGYTTALDDAIQYAYNNSVLIVAAAGNADIVGGIGNDLDKIPQSPVCNDGSRNMVIGVGAVDEQNHRPQWSSYGMKCVDIWAPGVDILSTAVPAYSTFKNFYDIQSGTSFSAPIITGIVSLLKATYPTVTSEEAINLLISNSNNGVVDAYKTLSAYFQPANRQVIQNSTPSNIDYKTGTENQAVSPRDTGTGTEIKKITNPSKIEELLPAVGAVKNENDEKKYKQLIESDANAYKVPLSSDQKTAVTNFVTYGISDKTVRIGAGERRALVRDYFETVGRGDVNWGDIENLVNGQKVVSRNLDKERAQVNTVLKMFKKIFGHDPIFSNPTEDLAWNTMMYRIRFPRDLEKEKAGIGKFQAIFKQSPKSPLDWATVRALGYVKK